MTRTRRLLVAHEAPGLYGWGAEIAAAVAESCWDVLAAPPVRVAAPRAPVPYATTLEPEIIPSVDRLAAALAELVRGGGARPRPGRAPAPAPGSSASGAGWRRT